MSTMLELSKYAEWDVLAAFAIVTAIVALRVGIGLQRRRGQGNGFSENHPVG
jgi:hypothetical protein